MVYDPTIGRVILFSGMNQAGDAFLNDTWAWDGSTWTSIPAIAPPAGRYVSTMVFDPRAGKVVLFGGYNATSGYLNQTYLFDISVFTGPALKTSASLSWASTTLNGYDQYRQASLSVSVPVPTGNNWNVSVNEFTPLTSGSNTLPKLTVNGSSTNAAASTAPTVSSTGSVPTSTGSVTYPVTVPLAGTAVVYAAQFGTGSGTVTIPLNVWATVPANAAAGTYTNVVTVSTNFGP